MIDRPTYVTDQHLEYLDELRESGLTNMYGAAPFLVDELDMSKGEAYKTLYYWMATFGERNGHEP